MFIDVFLTCHIQFQTPSSPSFLFSPFCDLCVLLCVHVFFLWIILICHFSPSSDSMSTQHHKGATFNTSHADAHQQIHTCTSRKVMRGRELKISAHILTFCHSFSLSLSSTHTLTVIVCLLQFFTHTCTNIPEPSKLESKVPIALLIRNAPGRVSKKQAV